jgi:hypothetical protein
MWFFMWWSLSSLLSALLIIIDMRRLGASRVGLEVSSWIAAALVLGPLAGLAYLFKRPAARRQLVEAVWRLIGDDSHPVSTRRARLDALRRSGIVGPAIYRTCLLELGKA